MTSTALVRGLAAVVLAGLAGTAVAQTPVPPRLSIVEVPPPRAESAIEDDVAPSLLVYEHRGVALRVGGLLQLHLAPYVGDDALLDDDDPAAREGFLLRRARLGVEAALPSHLRVLLVLDPLEDEPGAGAVSEARVSYEPRPWLRLAAGADKVPFTRGELASSAALASIERPLTVQTLVPQRRLGAVAEGALFDDALTYVAGVMNATEGYARGNQFAGLLYVARLQYRFAASSLEVGVGAGGYYEDGPATNTIAGSADLRLAVAGAALLVEALCDRITPDDAPTASPEVADELSRCGGYAQASYRLGRHGLEPVARLEWLDDNTGVDDAGDALLVAAGVNAQLDAHLRLQLHYLGRYERHAAERANDAVILAVQGAF